MGGPNTIGLGSLSVHWRQSFVTPHLVDHLSSLYEQRRHIIATAVAAASNLTENDWQLFTLPLHWPHRVNHNLTTRWTGRGAEKREVEQLKPPFHSVSAKLD